MAKKIAIINERVPNAQGSQILLNDDRKFYLYHEGNYKELTPENISNLEEKGCLDWDNDKTREITLNYIEQQLWSESRPETVVLPNRDESKIYDEGKIQETISKKKLYINIGFIVANLLLIIGIVLLIVFKPTIETVDISEENLYIQEIAEDVGSVTIPISHKSGGYITSNDLSSPFKMKDNSVQLLVFNNLNNEVPIYLSPLNYQTNGFKQSTPIINNNSMIFTDNRYDKEYYQLYFSNLNNYNSVPVPGLFSEGEESTFATRYTTEHYGLSNQIIVYDLIKNKGTGVQESYLALFSLSDFAAEDTYSQNIEKAKSFDNIFVSNSWLVYSKNTGSAVENTIINYEMIDSGRKFNVLNKTILTPEILGFEYKDIKIWSLVDNYLLLQVDNSKTVIISLDKLLQDKAEAMIFNSELNILTNSIPIIHKDYMDRQYIIYLNEQGQLISQELGDEINKVILYEINPDKDTILNLYSHNSKIYWTHSFTEQGEIKTKYYYGVTYRIPEQDDEEDIPSVETSHSVEPTSPVEEPDPS